MGNQKRKMLKKISSSKLFVSQPPPYLFGNPGNEPSKTNWNNENWLKSRFHFNFAEWRNGPSQFGVLRVMNDDLVQPERGFGAHPHQNMEIVTYVVHGALSHKDSHGNAETLGRGSIQFMTAGTGVRHSEYNQEKETLRFIQMWILPSKSNLTPNYGSYVGDEKERWNRWQHLVSSVTSSFKTPVKINQDANIYVAEVSQGHDLSLRVADNRQAYVLCVEGNISIQGNDANEQLDVHEACEVFGDCTLKFAPLTEKAHILVVEMRKTGSR